MTNGTLSTQAYIRDLLNGATPDREAQPFDAAPYVHVLNALHMAYDRDGTIGVLKDYARACEGYPEFAEMMQREPCEPSAWAGQWVSGDDLLREPEPTNYAVEGIIVKPSITIFFGGAGAKKSMLLAEMAVCVAHGLPWLPEPALDVGGKPLPTTKIKPNTGIKVQEMPVLWIDINGGRKRTLARLWAILNTRGITTPTNLHVISMPDPRPHADTADGLLDLRKEIERFGAGLVVIDCLSDILGPDVDENSHEMAKVFCNLRYLSDATDSVILPIHHCGHAGGRERGSSTIRAEIDLSIEVKSDPDSEFVTLKPSKVRDAYFEELCARWTYAQREGDYALMRAMFWRAAKQKKRGSETEEDRSPKGIILEIVHESPGITLSDLKARLDATGKRYSRGNGWRAFRAVVQQLEDEGKLSLKPGPENSRHVFLADSEDYSDVF